MAKHILGESDEGQESVVTFGVSFQMEQDQPSVRFFKVQTPALPACPAAAAANLAAFLNSCGSCVESHLVEVAQQSFHANCGKANKPSPIEPIEVSRINTEYDNPNCHQYHVRKYIRLVQLTVRSNQSETHQAAVQRCQLSWQLLLWPLTQQRCCIGDQQLQTSTWKILENSNRLQDICISLCLVFHRAFPGHEET